MSSFPLTTVNVYQRVAKRSISCIPGRRTRHVRRGAWESHDPPWCWLGVLALIGSEIYSCHVLGTQCLTHYPLVNVYKKLWKITIFQLVNPLCLWSFLISYAIYGNIYHQYIYIPQMLAYIPYMDPMGRDIHHGVFFFPIATFTKSHEARHTSHEASLPSPRPAICHREGSFHKGGP